MDLFNTHTEFTTPIRFDECVRRLKIMHAIIPKSKFSPTDAEDYIDFRWYGDSETFLRSCKPFLFGSLESIPSGTLVKTDYWLLRDPRWITVAMIVLYCFLVLTKNNIPAAMMLFVLGLDIVICILSWMSFYWYRRNYEGLEKRLREALSSPALNEEEYNWMEEDNTTYILILLLLLAILIPICVYLELHRIMIYG